MDLDTRTLKRTGDQVIAWIRSTYSPPTKIGDIEGIADTTDRWIVNCSEQAIKTSSLTAYSKSGAVLHSATYPYATWKQAIPDSMGETILQSVCNE